ncbi:electron transfer flavoprotein subunit alpha/FixB family protein [Bacillus sp. B15-48]|uniref:electron transfer flavoprotein subunit alpha/FixB family protein n=1 Tax=Bacillus sp. B15-48 TaxID=1548601 RepID=UPI00193F53AB|nr:electron transfer flavoprotein subunit alpha/FixB family protein [Bacillus sp. B15-48]MBM4765279.1 electron transfer flavoprotein subunit alpha/FixB family protein [Bacillus sp. B15-48]
MTAQGIWIFAEQSNGVQDQSTFELLGKALELKAQLNEEITAVLLGYQIQGLTEKLIQHGADKVIVVDNPVLAYYNPRPYAKVLEELCVKYDPSIFLFAATSFGRDLAPRAMAKLGTGLTADCLDLEVNEDGILEQIKPSFGGNIMCKIIIPEARPQMVTVRPNIFPVLLPNINRRGEVIVEAITVEDDFSYEIIEEQPLVEETVTLESADFIVSIGRGIGKKDNLRVVVDLVEATGAKLAVTRPLVDNGWFTPFDQIGQSGKTVKPQAILNLGISGAVHYTVGMQNSGLIISVNSNKDNELFKMSDYAAVADIKTLLPELAKQLQNKKVPVLV